jgi:hypothetical protein
VIYNEAFFVMSFLCLCMQVFVFGFGLHSFKVLENK